MINDNEKFEYYQIVIIIIASMLGVSMLNLPSSLAEALGNEAWIGMIIGGLAVIVSTFLICKAGSVYNGVGLVDACRNIFGKKLGVILLLPLVIALFIGNCVEARMFSITVKIFLLEKTPMTYILIPFLLIILFLCRGELRQIVRFLQFVLPVIVLGTIIINLMTIPGTDFTNMLPLFQKDIVQYAEGFQGAIFSLLGLVTLLVFYPYLRNNKFKNGFRASLVGVLIPVGLYILITILCISKIGVGETKWIIYPTINLAKSAYIPGGFVERLEGLLMSMWVILVFTTMIITIYAMSIVIANIFKLQHPKHVVTILLPFIYLISHSTISGLDMMNISKVNDTVFGTYTMFILPALIYFVYRIKCKRRGGQGV